MRGCWLALLLSLLAAPAAAADLKIATWNLNWLTSREAGLPPDVKSRTAEDFERLRGYAQELNADVVAFQEVDSVETARRVFPPDAYSIHMSRDRLRQRVGIAVRRGLHYEVNPDLTALALDPVAHLRSGVDITLHPPSGPVRLLAVHLKQGCQHLSFGKTPRISCVTLMAQIEVVTRWIGARREESAAFLVLGDFNRNLEKRDRFRRALLGPVAMTRATEGYSSPCWGREPFIDHILMGGPARDWVKPNSLRVLSYRETDPALKTVISDHCPVSIHLTVPD